jgi:tetratricopeptide (TPR) repeat protein
VADTVETSHAADAISPTAETVPAAPRTVELGEGSRIGRYTILRRLGAGGMGVVYAARDAELARDIALKVLREDRGGSSALELRLQREAQAMARLAHANVVRVFDVGNHAGHTFLAMELVDGATVAEWLAQAPRTWREIVDVYRAAGRGLAEAHAAGIVHRDFKPGNVMIEPRGRVLVSDFGLARAAARGTGDFGAVDFSEPLTRDGALVGTPRYMAPEQLAREDATVHSDQFAFAVALFEGVAGAPPFRGNTASDMLEQIRGGELPPARMPGWLRRLLARALAADPAKRFPSMDALLVALDRGRKRAARVAIVAGVAGLAAGSAALAFALGGRGVEVCAHATDRAHAAWTPAQRANVLAELPRLRPAFGAQTAQRVVDRLDAYARALAEQQMSACRTTVGQSAPSRVYDPQCLDDEARSLAKIASALGDAPTAELVDHADGLLGELADCSHRAVSSVAPPAETQRAAVEHLRDQLADADLLVARGDYAGARDAMKPLAATARELGYAPATAVVLARLGTVELKLQDKQAETDLGEAAELAAGARDDRTAVKAWTSLLAGAGSQPDRPEVYATTLLAARTAAARTGEAADLAQLELVVGESQITAGKFADAETSCNHALAELVRLHGDASLEVRPALHCIGKSLEERGQYPEAQKRLEQALAIDNKVLGKDHPETADDLQTLGQLELRTGKFKDGLARTEHALAVREKVFGPEADAVAKSHQTLANLLIDSGHPADAMPHAQRAIDIAVKNHGADSAFVAPAYSSLGTAYYDLHRHPEALPLFQHAIAIYERVGDQGNLGITLINLADQLIADKQWPEAERASRRAITALETGMGQDSPIVGFGLYDTARCLNATGRADEALPLLEHALQLTDPKTSDPNTVAIFEFEMARSLWATNGDHARALRLAHDAHDKLVAIGDTAGSPEERAAVEEFLRAHQSH